MALVHGVNALAKEKKLTITAVHVDHGFREESCEDASFTIDYLNKLGVSSVLVKLEKLPPNTNLEEFGREGRYAAFEDIRKKNNADWCLTAHHQGDLAETFLMQILFSRRVFGILNVDEKRRILRPLLHIKKTDIESYARDNNIPWIEDASNFSLERLRNQIRHRVLPFLREELGDHVDSALATSISEVGELAQGFSEYVINEVKSSLSNYEFGSKEWFRSSLEVINKHPELLRPFILEEIFLPILGFRIGAKHRKRLYQFWIGNSLSIELPSGAVLKRSEGGLILKS